MTATSRSRPISALVAVTYLLMVTVNSMANILPLNGCTQPGDVSDAIPNLFALPGYAFSIWSVITYCLGLHVLYQLGRSEPAATSSERAALLDKVGSALLISSLANAAWAFARHYDVIALSVVLIVVILACLAVITRTVHSAEPTTTTRRSSSSGCRSASTSAGPPWRRSRTSPCSW